MVRHSPLRNVVRLLWPAFLFYWTRCQRILWSVQRLFSLSLSQMIQARFCVQWSSTLWRKQREEEMDEFWTCINGVCTTNETICSLSKATARRIFHCIHGKPITVTTAGSLVNVEDLINVGYKNKMWFVLGLWARETAWWVSRNKRCLASLVSGPGISQSLVNGIGFMCEGKFGGVLCVCKIFKPRAASVFFYKERKIRLFF